MACSIKIQGQDVEIPDDSVAELISSSVNLVARGMVAAAELFNAAEDALRVAAVRQHGVEPWRAFLSPDIEEMSAVLLRIGLKPVVELPAIKPLGKAPRHEMKAGCGGDTWDNQG